MLPRDFGIHPPPRRGGGEGRFQSNFLCSILEFPEKNATVIPKNNGKGVWKGQMPFGVFPKHHSNLCFSSYLLNAQSSLLNAKVMLELNSILLLGIMDNVMSNICLFKSWARQGTQFWGAFVHWYWWISRNLLSMNAFPQKMQSKLGTGAGFSLQYLRWVVLPLLVRKSASQKSHLKGKAGLLEQI